MSVRADNVGRWLDGSGPQADVAISSRVRLARNLEGYPFVNRATAEEQKDIWDGVGRGLKGSRFFGHARFLDITGSSMLDRTFLMERNLISREHAYRSGPRGVVVGDDEMMSVMVNEEDHIRLQVIRSGLCLRDTWCMIDILDSDLGSLMGYAFSDRLGFLTACPTNLGTGLRASVMVHLPALSLTGQLRSALDEVRGLGLSARGLHGEGTRATGDMLQLSNRNTLGKSEEDTISQVERAAGRMVNYEERARHSLWQRSRAWVEDKVRASAEALFDRGSLSTEEGLSYLSIMRLGIYLGLISPIDSSKLNGLFILIQPAHLQKIAGVRMEAVERDEARAALIRGQLRRGLREALREPA